MFRPLFFLFFLATVAAQLIPPSNGRRCPKNETWAQCYSSSCKEATCERPTIPDICTMDCRQGCICKKGFYRHSNGRCVTFNKCRDSNSTLS